MQLNGNLVNQYYSCNFKMKSKLTFNTKEAYEEKTVFLNCNSKLHLFSQTLQKDYLIKATNL